MKRTICFRLRIAVALIATLATGSVVAFAQQAHMKVLFDTDIGTDIDDAWALGYALQSPSFELLGVTVTDADTPKRARLACKLLQRLGRTNVPVAVGRQTAAVPPDRIDYQFTWAEDFEAYKPISTPAVEFLADTIRRNPNEVTLIAVGPLQNIGDLVRLHPDVIPLVKRVVLMSGSIGANAFSSTAVPEWNVRLAIPEAQAVYAADWPLTIALEALLRLWSDRPTSRMTMHDQTALAEAQHPGKFFNRCEPMPLRVDGEGYTRVDRAGGRPVVVCLEPKRNDFMAHYLAQLASK